MDEDTGRRVCSLIAGVLCSDNKMSEDERSFLKRVLTQCGLVTDTALMPTYGEDIAEELARLPADARAQILDLVVQAAAADGEIVPAERAYVDLVARELGVSDEEVVARIGRALPAVT